MNEIMTDERTPNMNQCDACGHQHTGSKPVFNFFPDTTNPEGPEQIVWLCEACQEEYCCDMDRDRDRFNSDVIDNPEVWTELKAWIVLAKARHELEETAEAAGPGLVDIIASMARAGLGGEGLTQAQLLDIIRRLKDESDRQAKEADHIRAELLEACKWALPLVVQWFNQKPHCQDHAGLTMLREAIDHAR